MIEIRIGIDGEKADLLEAYFCEDYQEHWMLHENWLTGYQELRGYFNSQEEISSSYEQLKSQFSWLSEIKEQIVLEDKDWKEAYKLHFKPWSDRGLHWVPIWEKETYELPKGDQIVYLDPGMAFGTGNHETTRLCVRRLLDLRDELEGETGDKILIDAGCGSGILAISARKLGFGDCYGFDNDPDAVKISQDNEQLCGLEREIEFRWADLVDGLKDRSADLLLANILANVLVDHRELLVDSVKDGGWLVLSGILAREVEAVHESFSPVVCKRTGIEPSFDSMIDGEWADLVYKFPQIAEK